MAPFMGQAPGSVHLGQVDDLQDRLEMGGCGGLSAAAPGTERDA